MDWVHGLHLVAGAGDPTLKHGLGIILYAAGKDMGKEAFYSADGDFLIVPQHGVLDIQTELGRLMVRPNEICVIPRGVRSVISCPATLTLIAWMTDGGTDTVSPFQQVL